MKPQSILSVFALSTVVHAAPLLTDNFNTDNYDASTFNNTLAADQGGSFAPITYSTYAPGGGYTAQHSNGGSMIVVGNNGIQGGRASLNRNFAVEANYADKPLSISFTLADVTNSGDPTIWGHFGVGSSQLADYFGTDFAMFMRSNGDWIARDNNAGADLGSGTYVDGDLITYVFSDTAGTGSAFNGNGSKVTITVGAATPVTYTLNQLTAADGYLTWGGFPYYQQFMVMAIDNLSVDMDATFPAGEAFVWSGAVDANWDEATANWSNVNSFTKWFNHPGTPNNAVFDATGSAQPNVTLALNRPLELGTLTFDTAGYNIGGSATLGKSPNIVANADATISATLQGGVSLTKSGPAKLTLGANNTYTGNTILSEGVLEVSSTGKIYGAGYTSSPVVTLAAGTTLRLSEWNYDAAGSLGGLDFARERLVVNGGTIEYAGNSNDGSNGGAAGRNLTVGIGGATLNTFTAGQTWTLAENGGYGALINDNGLTLGGAGNGVIAKVISGTGSVTKTGSGTWTLSGANTYTGTTTVNAGTLSLTSPSLDSTSSVVIGPPGAILNLNFSGNDVVSALEINGSGPLAAGAYNSSHPTYGSYFTGSGTLLVVNGSNGFWTSLVDGNWEEPANWASATIAAGFDQTATFNATTGVTVTLTGGLTIGNLVFDVSDYTIAGAPLLLDASGTPAINVASGRTATIAANLDGIVGMEKTGTGTLVLTGNKSYTGGTTVTSGTLELSGGNSGNAQIHGAITVGSGGTLAFTNGDGTGFGYFNNPVNSITVDGGTINAVSGSHLGFGPFASMMMDNGALLSGSWQWNGDGLLSFYSYGDSTNTISGNLVLRADAGSSHTFFVDDGASATDLQINANLSDQWPEVWWVSASGLTKTGTGTLVLNGTNTYDGNTLVNDGALTVTASGSLRFRPTTNGATNSVSGTSTAVLDFDGTVSLDLGAAVATGGNVWNLFNLASFSGPAPTLQPTAVTSTTLGSFTEVSAGVWELPVTGAKWVFTEADGNLAYVITATDYDNWETANGVTGGPNDDDDNDGLTNNDEYAFGLDPTGGSSVNPIAVPLDKSTGTFSYTRRLQSLTGLNYTIWYSTDLTGWTQDTGAVQGIPSVSGEVETVPVTLTNSLLTNPKLFIQVRAE